MKIKKILMIFGIILLIMFLLVTFSTYRGLTGGKRIDVTKLQRSDHPLFAGEKREDNSVDYIEAIERINSQGVTKENNFGVAIFELAPNDSELRPELRSLYREKLVFNEASPHRFHTMGEITDQLKTTLDTRSISQLMYTTTVESFVARDSDEELLRKVINFETPSLDQLLLELDRRSKYYVPLVGDDSEALIAVMLPHAQHQRQFGRWLKLRSDMNLADGELAAAWRDIRGMYQLGNRVSQGFSVVEYLIGIAVSVMANEQMERLLNSPGLTKELIKQISADLPLVNQLPPWTQSLDRGERAMLLNIFDLLVEGKLDAPGFNGGNGTPTGKGIPMGWVDSVKLADDWNLLVDRIIAATEKSPKECAAEFDQIEMEFSEMQVQGRDVGWLIGKAVLGGAPRKEGTKITETLLFRFFTPAVRQMHQASIRQQAAGKLVRLAVAARQYEFENQELPDDLQKLVPLVPPDVLIDPVSGSNLLLEFVDVLDGEHVPGDTNPILRLFSAGNFPGPEFWRIDLIPADQVQPRQPLNDNEPD